MRASAAAVLLAGLLAACARGPALVAEAERAGLVAGQADTAWFRLATWSRLAPADELAVYLEGDGRAWLDRDTPSRDPTPGNPVALALAARDPAPAVLYLARPCQYSGRADPRCDSRYWTSARFAPEVVDAADAAIRLAMAAVSATRLRLVGYSGGGVLAALLAQRHAGTVRLVTLASPLDVDGWTGLHRVSPLSASLKPAAAALAGVPQLHLSGAADRVVPPGLTQAWLETVPGTCAQWRTVPGFDHECCWAGLSPAELAVRSECDR